MPKKKKSTADQPAKTSLQSSPHLLRGFKDILPKEQKYWNHLERVVEKIAFQYGYKRIETPILEETSLFVRSVGKETDIVSKEMFSFVDKGGENVCLRPEITASVVRAYIEHGMHTYPQPVRVYYSGPVFRREKPQSGRLRGFHQFGFEVLGNDRPVVDAQLILIARNICLEAGLRLQDFVIQVNSIGDLASREEYLHELSSYFKSKKKYLSPEERKRITKNPMRLLDSVMRDRKDIFDDAPQILDWLNDESKNHFMEVLEILDALEISYVLNPYLVRGLDYYTRTVFEIYPAGKEEFSQSAIGAGGRYDGLIELLGGDPTPAGGFAFGYERFIALLKDREVKIRERKPPQVYLAQIGKQAKIQALKLFEKLRKEGFAVYENFSKDSLKSQLEQADKLEVRYTIIIGQKEVLDGTVLVRDMESGVQEIVNYEKVTDEIRRKLAVK